MKFKYKFLATCAALALAGPASAAKIQFDLLEARFDNPVGGNVLYIDNAFTDPAGVYWGQDGKTPGVDASGYLYESRDTPFTEVPDEVFGLGTFTHDNFPIAAGTFISQVDFFIRGLVSVLDDDDNVLENIGAVTFGFRVFHDETPNRADPCAYEGPGIDNSAGCADRVIIETLDGSESFTIDGFKYTLTILGFSVDLADATAGIFDPEFFSAENASNSRILAAKFTKVEVPAPAAGLMLLGGLIAVAGIRRRRS